jgi:hypothetical protein
MKACDLPKLAEGLNPEEEKAKRAVNESQTRRASMRCNFPQEDFWAIA